MITRLARTSVAVFGAWLAVTSAETAHAISITWTFTGVVRQVGVERATELPSTLVELGVEIGAPVSGFIRFESTTPDVRPEPALGRYEHAIDVAAITVGGWSLAQGVYFPDPSFITTDYWIVYSYLDSDGAFAASQLFDPTGTLSSFADFALELSAPASFLDSDAILIDPPSLASLDPYGLDLTSPWGYGTDIFLGGCALPTLCLELRAEVTSLQRVSTTPPLPVALPNDVPEPGGLVALAIAMLAARFRA